MTESEAQDAPGWLRGQNAPSILKNCQRRFVPANASLCLQGEATDRCYLVVEGSVEVSRRLAGKTHRISVFGPGCLLGLMPALDGAPCALTIRTLSEARVIEIRRDDLLAALTAREESPAPLVEQLSLLAIRRLRSATDELSRAIHAALRSPEQSGRLDALRLARIQANGYIWLDS